MIDLINGSNGNNKNEPYIPCPACAECEGLKQALSEAAIYSGQPILDVLQILVSELKMWRAKDEFERRTKIAITQMVEQKLKNGLQMDS
jgi:hypothetical protein